MGRPKAFDRDVALEKAMQLFWVKGYEAASLEELLLEMGIGRQSLYDTFGDKRALYLATLDRYGDQLDGFLRSCLADAPTIREALSGIFHQVAAEPVDEKRRGCLLVNTAIEIAPHDSEAARRVTTSQRASERLFERALELAVERGELPRERAIRPLARFLVSALQGLQVAAKTDPDRGRLRDIADVALSVLG